MKIRNAEITMSAVSKKQYPSEGVPEIALAGRSNVGKSSLINGLLNKRNFARTSSTPGKTRTINFYLINNEFYFVDLPGYGYAKVSKTEKEKWGGIMQQYLESREELCSILLLVDVRHEPTEDDKLMYEWIKFFGYDCIVVATKADKISRGQYQKHVSIIRKKLQMDSNDKVILTSASKKIGFSQLWDSIVESYEEHGYEINYEKTTE
ncbi:ribosome biogenesis GTP-binding protein YihA/YsxC [Peptostreptococcus faecalis]|uniref:ribosome biogenesis GTP-binding protein YihA/YsxC n=1 Tax=Peptostreptococcus faecalis TaxID=2045015 RepID=UPI001FA8EA65